MGMFFLLKKELFYHISKMRPAGTEMQMMIYFKKR